VPTEVRAIRLPKGEKQRFNRLLDEAGTALDEVAYVVRDAILHEVAAEHDMLWSDAHEEAHRREIVDEKGKDGLLVDCGGSWSRTTAFQRYAPPRKQYAESGTSLVVAGRWSSQVGSKRNMSYLWT
jgi:predicted DNA-binding protein